MTTYLQLFLYSKFVYAFFWQKRIGENFSHNMLMTLATEKAISQEEFCQPTCPRKCPKNQRICEEKCISNKELCNGTCADGLWSCKNNNTITCMELNNACNGTCFSEEYLFCDNKCYNEEGLKKAR